MRELIGGSGTDFVAFAVTGVLVLLVSLIYVWWLETSSGKLSCPGLKSKDEKLGNLGELTKDGGLHQFLVDNHKKLGPIFSFFWGKELSVSIASPSLFNNVVTLFDRSVGMYEVFKPMIGRHSIQYMNSPEGPKHRKIHDRHYGFSAVKDHFAVFSEIGTELVGKWRSIKHDEHIPLSQHMLVISVKSIVKSAFGGEYFKTNKEILALQEVYHFCWDEMEERIGGNPPDDERQELFDEKIAVLRDKVREMIEHRRASKERANNFLDVLLDEEELYPTDDHIVDMVVTYLVGGSHTTGYLLTWAIFFICLHPEVERKIYEEIVQVLGNDDVEMTPEHCKQMNYMEKVINETLRCSVLAPFATRCSCYDIIVGGHVIPKGTPLVLALGTVMQDDKIWPEPKKFDPERFSPEQVGLRDAHSFEPFGFAGKRKCPAYRFAYYEAYAYLTAMIRNFKLKLVDEQRDIPFRHGLVTQFTEEVWVKVEQR